MDREPVRIIDAGHGVKAKLYYDPDPESPRERDNLTTIYGWHPRYAFGDKHDYREPRDLLTSLCDDHVPEAYWAERWELAKQDGAGETLADMLAFLGLDPDGDLYGPDVTIDEIEYDHRDELAAFVQDEAENHDLIAALREHGVHIRPLYAYIHSGVTVSMGAFTDPWDSGQVGYVVVTPEDQKKIGTPDDLVEAVMEGEVDTYDRYLRGEVYGYVVETPDDDHADSCWGFDDEDHAIEAATDAAEYLAANYASADHFLGAGI